MRHKKLKLSIVLFLGIGLTGLQAQNMYVKEKSGTQTTYSLSAVKKISFLSGNIAISKIDGNSDVYSLERIRYLSFRDLSTSIIPLPTMLGVTEVQIYPNPVIDAFNIHLSKSENQNGIIEILSIDGIIVYSKAINSHNNDFHVDVTSLSKGLYLCRINKGTSIETIKFIKQ